MVGSRTDHHATQHQARIQINYALDHHLDQSVLKATAISSVHLCSNFNHKHVRRHVLYFDVGRLPKIKDIMSTPESRAEKVSDTAKFSWPHLCPSMWEYHFEGSEWAKQVVDACVISLGLAHFFEWGLKTSILENLCGPATGSLKWWWPMAFHMQIHMHHMHAWISGEQAFQHDSTGKKPQKCWSLDRSPPDPFGKCLAQQPHEMAQPWL